MDYAQITEKILQTIARDDELIEQFAKALDIEREAIKDYLDNVRFPAVGHKTE
jgi:DNA polymerase I-like protein with 3'-5' exonuclease and polymerase domains